LGTADRLLKLLDEEFPTPRVALNYKTPLQLLVATILSAQCTDERVNQVTKGLFARYQTAKDYAEADPARLQEEIRPTGFYKAKARSLIKTGQALVSRFGGEVPRTMEELVTLQGVGRKTANVILGNCFGVPGVVVDTHVTRVTQRLGLVDTDDPEKIEVALQRLLPMASGQGPRISCCSTDGISVRRACPSARSAVCTISARGKESGRHDPQHDGVRARRGTA